MDQRNNDAAQQLILTKADLKLRNLAKEEDGGKKKIFCLLSCPAFDILEFVARSWEFPAHLGNSGNITKNLEILAKIPSVLDFFLISRLSNFPGLISEHFFSTAFHFSVAIGKPGNTRTQTRQFQHEKVSSIKMLQF